MPSSKPMKLYYQGKGTNFGDAINYDIFHDLFNCDVISSRPYNADCMAIGSILNKILYETNRSAFDRQNIKKTFASLRFRKRPIDILGSGFIEDVRKTYPRLNLFRPVNVIALRGRLTQEIMEEILGHKLDNVVLGDPGILVSEFIKGEKIETKYRMGIVPHICDKMSDLLDEFRNREDTCILDIEAKPLDFLRSMAACSTVASSSLHGLVTADSLHIPNAWIKFSDKLMGNDYKFHDYYSAYGLQAIGTDLRNARVSDFTSEYIVEKYQVASAQVQAVKSGIAEALRSFIHTAYPEARVSRGNP